MVLLTRTSGTYSFSISEIASKTIYVDAENGNDDNDGLTEYTAVSTFDRAMDISDGVADVVVLSNLTIDQQYDAGVSLTLRPLDTYGATITFGSLCEITADVIKILGENEILLGSVTFDDAQIPFKCRDFEMKDIKVENAEFSVMVMFSNRFMVNDGYFRNVKGDIVAVGIDDYYSHIENSSFIQCTLTSIVSSHNVISMEQVNVRDSKLGTLIATEGDIHVNNLSLDVDTLTLSLFSCEDVETVSIRDLEVSNTIVSQESLLSFYDVSHVIAESISIHDCKAPLMMSFRTCGTTELSDIKLNNNTYNGSMNGMPEWADETNCAGIFLYHTTAKVSNSFVVDTDNYVFLCGEESYLVLSGTDELMARLMPLESDMYGNMTSDYAEGRRMLGGEDEVENYQYFLVAQHDASAQWAIDNDGLLYEVNEPGPEPEPEPEPSAIQSVDALSYNVYSAEGQLVIEGAEGETLAIYDIAGHKVYSTSRVASSRLSIAVPNTGVYLVSMGGQPARRVVVMR